ncbi:MAG TPA: J domain-containing protein [Gammaproteobacteria bacterium]|nr:J domain-containing protein [Gammaproteobacteria bacterium]
MDADPGIARCYRLLGVDPPCSWAEVRRAYRREIRRCHPDRAGRDAPARVRADRQSAEINRAYDVLRRYYRNHGVLPEVAPDRVRSATPAPVRRRSRRRYVLAAAAGAATLVWLIHHQPPPSSPRAVVDAATPGPDQRGQPAPRPEIADAPHFGAGSSVGDVFDIEGVPGRVIGDTWYYGPSWVRFSHGEVIAWHSEPQHPLQSDPAYPLDYGDAPTRRGRLVHARHWGFTVGSSAAEVYAVQGPPDVKRDGQWRYGASRVYFHDGRVTGWYSDPARPLRTTLPN